MTTEKKTELLILGVNHLDADVTDVALAPAIERLTAWNPAAIAVELLPGDLIDHYTREAGIYDVLHVGGIDRARELSALARQHRGWTRTQAQTIAQEPKTPAVERVLAWLIALEPWNALIHAQSATGLPATVRTTLDELARRHDEVTRVALPIARNLGHCRLFPFDDHTGLELLSVAGTDWSERLQAAGFYETIQNHPGLTARPMPRSAFTEDIWPYWQVLNSTTALVDSEDVESGLYARLDAAAPVNSIRLAQWRTRNLFMAARLRLITGLVTGQRVLAIVGQAHVSPLRAALTNNQHDLRLIGPEQLG